MSIAEPAHLCDDGAEAVILGLRLRNELAPREGAVGGRQVRVVGLEESRPYTGLDRLQAGHILGSVGGEPARFRGVHIDTIGHLVRTLRYMAAPDLMVILHVNEGTLNHCSGITLTSAGLGELIDLDDALGSWEQQSGRRPVPRPQRHYTGGWYAWHRLTCALGAWHARQRYRGMAPLIYQAVHCQYWEVLILRCPCPATFEITPGREAPQIRSLDPACTEQVETLAGYLDHCQVGSQKHFFGLLAKRPSFAAQFSSGPRSYRMQPGEGGAVVVQCLPAASA